ncbi:RNA polymerase sigma factor [Streptomyces sp. NPDC003487]
MDLGKRLLDYYDEFMAKEPRFLHNKFRGRLSEQACEDVAQEAFLKVATKAAAGDLGPDVKIGAYLRTTSWHLAIDTLRAREQTIGAEREAVPSQPGEDCDPLEELVRPAIAALPRSRRRTVVQLQSQGLDDAQRRTGDGCAPLHSGQRRPPEAGGPGRAADAHGRTRWASRLVGSARRRLRAPDRPVRARH